MHRFTLCLALFALFCVSGCSGESDTDEISADDSPTPVKPPQFTENDWPWWRGPNRNGKSAEDHEYPVEFGPSKNVVWKAKVPGRGLSSPVVFGDKVFLTTAEADQDVQSLLCYDRNTGDLLWRKDVHQGGLGDVGHRNNSYASSTPACDGQRVFAVFRNSGTIVVTALDLEGTQQWQREVERHESRHGFGVSPIIYKELVIISADSTKYGFIAALNRKTGDIFWRKKRPAVDSYATPVVAHVAGTDQVLLAGGHHIYSYDPMTGEENWNVEAGAKVMCGTIAWEGDMIFASGGYPERVTVGVKVKDGAAEVVWKNRLKVYVPSLLVHEGGIYGISGSTFYCLNTETGDTRWKMRVGKEAYGSPVLAGGKVYAPTRDGRIHVITADLERPQDITVNKLGGEMDTTPTPVAGRFFCRVADNSIGSRQEWLYCIGTE